MIASLAQFWRTLLRHPTYVFFAVLTLALGIGANTALFSAVYAVVLNPLPYEDADRLAMLWRSDPRMGLSKDVTSFPNYEDWKAQGDAFEDMAAFTHRKLNLLDNDLPVRVEGALVTDGFFELLRVEPMLGRLFLPEESKPGGTRVALLSWSFWQSRYGGDPGILDQTLQIDDRTMQIIGVLPQDFEFSEASVWLPLAPSLYLRNARGSLWLHVVGRIHPGIPLAQAQSSMDAVAQRLAEEYPGINTGTGISVIPLHDEVVGNSKTILWVLFVAVTFVLLIACSNVANLQLVRAVGREKEMAVRAAVGAGRGRLVMQNLGESLWLALLGGLAGLGLAYLGLETLLSLAPDDVPRLDEAQIDSTVLAYTALITLVTGIAFGLWPALSLSQLDLNHVLSQNDRRGFSGKAGRGGVRRSIVVLQIALALMLLIGAGLMVDSLRRLQDSDPGFNPESVLTFQIGLPYLKYSEPFEILGFYTELLDRLQVVSGVEAAGAISTSPIEGFVDTSSILIAGRIFDETEEQLQVSLQSVTPDYFSVMEIPLLEGRFFGVEDYREAPPVVIINQAMADRYWPDGDSIGQRMKYRTAAADDPWMTVVGVVGNVVRPGLDDRADPATFRPHEQRSGPDMMVVVRSLGDPLLLNGPVRNEVAAIDSEQPVASMATMEELLSGPIAQQRFSMLLLMVFSAVALVLAVVGIYGALSYLVRQSTRELGVRMALGAQRSDLMGMVFRQGLRLALVGLVVGLAASFALSRWMSTLLFEVSATDPKIYLGLALLLGVVVLAASLLPARRATRVEPLIALRHE